ncbi:MAG: 2-C-methyl-D-erythritol 4-phosphate cytidylyltransferase [Pseudobutyrivibrio sp.]|nr:2-C-methyl-D-erythritol 4-phosphate cytidylyltransferase [Pseudobutyrivibrio sp.]
MNIAIVLSGGTGTRLGGDIPKQYVEVGGKPIIVYSLEPLTKSKYIDKIQIVAEETWVSTIEKWAKDFALEDKIAGYSKPGVNRQLSIYNGLKDVADFAGDESFVMIHDAARPNLTEDIISKSIEAMDGYDGVIPVLPMKDTVYLSKDGKQIDSNLKREEIFAGQAPETFVLGKYLAANESLVESGKILKINGSTEPAIIAGMKMHMIDGDEGNYKITTKDDLERFIEQIRR